mgnify:CR=1 FL=1
MALDQLKETCPNVEWVSVVLTWFGDALDAGACTISPSVEYVDEAITEPNLWNVAGEWGLRGRRRGGKISLICERCGQMAAYGQQGNLVFQAWLRLCVTFVCRRVGGRAD